MNGYYSFEEKAQMLAHMWVKSLLIDDPHLYPREIHLPEIYQTRRKGAQLNDPYKLIPSEKNPGRYVYRVPQDIELVQLSELANDRDGTDEDDDYDSEGPEDPNENVKRTFVYLYDS